MSLSERNGAGLRSRGIDPELAELYGIADSRRRGFDIEIPYFEGDRVVNRKYRNIVKRDSGDNFSQESGGKQVLWNLNVVTDPTLSAEPLVICEGELDALSAIQAGFLRAVSVPGGAPQESGQSAEFYGYILEARGQRDVNQLILCVDNDEPGINLLDDLARHLQPSRCRFTRYPGTCKDLNEVLSTLGVDEAQECLQTAPWMAAPGVYRLDELPPEPAVLAFDPGIPGLSAHYKIRPGDLAVITGIPASGKSTVVLNIAAHMAREFLWPVAIGSFEMRTRTEMLPILRSWYTGASARNQRDDEKAVAEEWIRRSFTFLRPDEEAESDIVWFLDSARAAVLRYGAKLVICDPWNELEHRREQGQTLTEYVGWAVKQLKRFAVRYRVHVIVAAHPAKLQRDRKTGKLPIPNLYDISDSSHFFNKPDVGVIVHREDDETTIRVDKARFRQIGVPGEIKLKFRYERFRYEPVFAGIGEDSARNPYGDDGEQQ